jgi:hypothetical protein
VLGFLLFIPFVALVIDIATNDLCALSGWMRKKICEHLCENDLRTFFGVVHAKHCCGKRKYGHSSILNHIF